MQIIKPNAYLIDDSNLTPYQKIEKCGRICYKSEKNITESSAVKFVNAMIDNEHTAMLEHAHIYTCIPKAVMKWIRTWLQYAITSTDFNNVAPYLNITVINNGEHTYMSGSFRTFINMFNSYFSGKQANSGMDQLYDKLSKKYSEIIPVKESVISNTNHEITIFDKANDFIKSVKSLKNVNEQNIDNIIKKHVIHSIVFVCDRGVSHEFVRHRPCSFAQESTRYCNYSKDKFCHEITVIEPCFYENKNTDEYNAWKTACETAENSYFKLIEDGSTAQQARSVLPNSLKTELVITATEYEWQHIINLRKIGTTGKPHPQMQEVMDIAYPILRDVSEERL